MTARVFLLIIVATLFIYFPALGSFYTNDDFYFLNISRAKSLGEFFSFFDITEPFLGFLFYRPLTTQAFYFLGEFAFNLNPIPLHILAYVFFILGVYLVYKLVNLLLSNNNVSALAVVLYAFSAIHFGHLYYLATFQELGVALFFLVSSFYFTKYILGNGGRFLFFSFIGFVAALASKETAVTLPLVLILIYLYFRFFQKSHLKTRGFLLALLPHLIILGLYLYFHVFHYGFPSSDSYFTDFSVKKTLNSTFWYGVWVLGLPEMLPDFVGSGLKLNPNLFKFWGREMTVIFSLFGIFLFILALRLWQARNVLKRLVPIFIFGSVWFITTLLPFLFFPFHKFAYSATISSFDLYLILAKLIFFQKKRDWPGYFCIGIFILLNVSTIALTKKTHWITSGQKIAERVFNYLADNKEALTGKTLVFYDTAEDSQLPWSPSDVVKVALSSQNFFDVFYPGSISALYDKDWTEEDASYFVKINSREFLGY